MQRGLAFGKQRTGPYGDAPREAKGTSLTTPNGQRIVALSPAETFRQIVMSPAKGDDCASHKDPHVTANGGSRHRRSSGHPCTKITNTSKDRRMNQCRC